MKDVLEDEEILDVLTVPERGGGKDDHALKRRILKVLAKALKLVEDEMAVAPLVFDKESCQRMGGRFDILLRLYNRLLGYEYSFQEVRLEEEFRQSHDEILEDVLERLRYCINMDTAFLAKKIQSSPEEGGHS